MLASVLLVCYNHEPYIERALASIVMQKTNFDFNIVIADDASQDDTVSRIKEFMKNYKDIPVLFIPSEQNLGITKNYQRAFNYIDNVNCVAVLEGDDEWTNKYRLQKHVNFLIQHPMYSMVFNQYLVINLDSGEKWKQPFASTKSYEQITVDRLIAET